MHELHKAYRVRLQDRRGRKLWLCFLFCGRKISGDMPCYIWREKNNFHWPMCAKPQGRFSAWLSSKTTTTAAAKTKNTRKIILWAIWSIHYPHFVNKDTIFKICKITCLKSQLLMSKNLQKWDPRFLFLKCPSGFSFHSKPNQSLSNATIFLTSSIPEKALRMTDPNLETFLLVSKI